MSNVGIVIDGAVLRALRDDKMLTMAQLALRAREFAKRLGERTSLDKATLSRAESGKSLTLSRDSLRFLVGALEPSQDELRLLLCGAKPPRVLVELCRDAPGRKAAQPGPAAVAATLAKLDGAIARLEAMAGDPDSLAPASGKEDDTQRSTFVRKVVPAALAAGLVPLAAVERLADLGRPRVEESLVAAFEDVAGALWQAHISVVSGQGELLSVVGPQAAAVRRVLRRPMTGAQRGRLFEVSVGLHTEAGLLALDLHDLEAADELFSLARAAAADSGLDRLQAQALQFSTHMLTSLRFGGRGGDDPLALARLEEAAVHAVHADAHTRAETFMRLAEQRALNGDEPGSQRALEQAHEQFARIDGSETGFSARSGAFLVPRWLRATGGRGHMLAGRNDEALADLEVALRDPTTGPRGAMQLHADLSRVWVQLGEPERACAELAAALDIAVPIDYRIGLARIHGARALFLPQWAPLSY
ncbi:MAG: hypothetical protein ACRDZO_26155, partial [Egibacteraceae bacterium]